MTFYDSWWYLLEHKAFADFNFINSKGQPYISAFLRLLDIDVQKVDPITHRVEDDNNRNTLTEVWLELGPQYQTDSFENDTWEDEEWHYNSHDMNLDCGGETFEIAIVNLANKVEEFYPLSQYGKIDLEGFL